MSTLLEIRAIKSNIPQETQKDIEKNSVLVYWASTTQARQLANYLPWREYYTKIDDKDLESLNDYSIQTKEEILKDIRILAKAQQELQQIRLYRPLSEAENDELSEVAQQLEESINDLYEHGKTVGHLRILCGIEGDTNFYYKFS